MELKEIRKQDQVRDVMFRDLYWNAGCSLVRALKIMCDLLVRESHQGGDPPISVLWRGIVLVCEG